MVRRGIEGTGGFSRIASLNAISDNGMASRLSNVVASPAATPSAITSSRSLSATADGRRAHPPKDDSDEVSVSCAAIIRKLMWSTISCVDSSAPSSWVAWHSCENKSSPPPLARRIGICSEK